jgi:hypothetical protein
LHLPQVGRSNLFAWPRHWYALIVLTVSQCAPMSVARHSRCYEVRTTVDSTGWGNVGEAWHDRDMTPGIQVDTFALSSAPVDPVLPDHRLGLPDSQPWYHVSKPSDSRVTWIVWRPQGDSVLTDTHDGFTGALYRLGRQGDTLIGGGIWIPDVGRMAAMSLRLVPLRRGCESRLQAGAAT